MRVHKIWCEARCHFVLGSSAADKLRITSIPAYTKSFMRVFALFPLAASLLAQHGQYLSDSKNPAIGNPEAIAAGTKLFLASCAGCHGPDGGGGARGPNLVRRSLWHP